MENTTRTPLFGSGTRSDRRDEGLTSEGPRPPILKHLAGAALVFLAAGAATVVARVIRKRRRGAR